MSSGETYRAFDAADYLRDEADIVAYLEAAAEDGDAEHFARALGTVARARNVSQLSRDTGLSRQGLIKALSVGGNPSLDTTLKVLNSLGMRFKVVSQQTSRRKSLALPQVGDSLRGNATKKKGA